MRLYGQNMSTTKNENIPLNSKNCSNVKICPLKILKNRVTFIDITGIHSLGISGFFNRDILSGDHIRVSHLKENL